MGGLPKRGRGMFHNILLRPRSNLGLGRRVGLRSRTGVTRRDTLLLCGPLAVGRRGEKQKRVKIIK